MGEKIAESGATPPPLFASNTVICTPLGSGVIAVQGADAVTFLQGQLTCDMQQLSAERSLLGAMCSAKGRVIAICRVLHRQDGAYMVLPQQLLASTLARLGKYVLRAQVRLHDASQDWNGIGIAGAAAAPLLTAVLDLPLPTMPNAVSGGAEILALRVPGAVPRFAIYGSVPVLGALRHALGERVLDSGLATWRLLDIEAALPEIYPATSETFVPQMLNLDVIGAISWQKGCYTGQEIIARAQYLGKVKRRMYLGRVNSAVPPQIGDLLFAGADLQNSVGQLINTAKDARGNYAFLAVIAVEHAERGDLYLDISEVGAVELLPLPYSL